MAKGKCRYGKKVTHFLFELIKLVPFFTWQAGTQKKETSTCEN